MVFRSGRKEAVCVKLYQMRLLLLCCAILGLKLAEAQKVNWAKLQSLHPDSVLQQGSPGATKVLLLGTFHFAYPQADAHKTDSSHFIDVLSASRQKELDELASVILRFKPTRIYIESTRQGYHDSLYSQYRKGAYTLDRNEIFQIGYRVAGRLNLAAVHAVDASSFANSQYGKIPLIDSLWKLRDVVDSARDKFWDGQYRRLYDAGDSVETRLTMLENFLLMAEPSTLYRMHGHYLAGGFNTKSNSGPDILAMWWYSRNLRIYNNILRTRPRPEDRILVLFGNGHMPILKHCFQSSPEFEVVELKSLLSK